MYTRIYTYMYTAYVFSVTRISYSKTDIVCCAMIVQNSCY